jgi:hypothetical protein
MMSNVRRFLVVAGLLLGPGWLAAARGAFAAPPAPSNDFAPGLPVGPLYASTIERPRDEAERPPACSFRHPVCVHATREIAPSVVLGTLADVERAASRLTAGVGLPWPLPDGPRGVAAAFDVYLVHPSAPSLAGAWETTARDDPMPGTIDRASAFALLRADAPPGPVRRNLVTRALASAIQWRLDAGEDPVIRESNAAYLAELVEPCGAITADLVDDFQAHPERALSSSGDAGPAAQMALPWYLDVAFGSGSPGIFPVALAVLGGQKTPAGNLYWHNEPDLFDVLRGVLKARTPPVALSDLLVDFAVARLFMGARDDGVHFPESAFLGTFGRVRFDWSVEYPSLPRRVSPERPIDPTGSTYVWIDLRGAPPGAHLALRMEWEAPVLFRWALVRVRPDGSEASRVLITPQQKSTMADRNLDDLGGLAGVALVGVNTGDLRLDDPFDPDVAPYEPHSYVLTVAALQP